MSGCYPGCFYYTDSCFRKDCKKLDMKPLDFIGHAHPDLAAGRTWKRKDGHPVRLRILEVIPWLVARTRFDYEVLVEEIGSEGQRLRRPYTINLYRLQVSHEAEREPVAL